MGAGAGASERWKGGVERKAWSCGAVTVGRVALGED
jgi:hypothetical protein